MKQEECWIGTVNTGLYPCLFSLRMVPQLAFKAAGINLLQD